MTTLWKIASLYLLYRLGQALACLRCSLHIESGFKRTTVSPQMLNIGHHLTCEAHAAKHALI